MLINFTKVSDEEVTYELLAEGRYILEVDKVEEKTTNNGNDYWLITYKTEDNQKVFDSLFFTDKTLNRVKKCFKCLGLDVDGEFDYDPDDIVGCKMNGSVIIEDYTDKNGNQKQKNTLNLWDCEAIPVSKKKKVVKATAADDEEIPF